MEDNRNLQIDNTASEGSQEPDLMKAFEVTQEQSEVNSGEISNSLEVSDEVNSEVEIDDRYKDLPKAEALLRTYQSRYDKVYNELQNTLRELEQYRQYKLTIDQLMEDDEVFEAFVYTRKPELVKEKDITELIKAKLEEEFKGYKPTREEAEEDPGGKAWLYYKRLDELYEEYKNKRNMPKTLEEVLKRKAEEKKKQEEILMKEIEETKKAMNWTDEQLIAFRNWANKLTIKDLAKMYNFAIRTMRLDVKPASSISGVDQNVKSARERFLKELKGY